MPERIAPVSKQKAVIFLDVDGVLCTHDSCRVADTIDTLAPRAALGPHVFDPVRVALLNKLCAETGAHIVVSSSWRDDDALRETLRCVGVTADFHDDWRTPKLGAITRSRPRSAAGQRNAEIALWLTAHPEADNFVVLDDMTLPAPLGDRQVVTSYYSGLSALDVEYAKHLLGFDDQTLVSEFSDKRLAAEAARQRLMARRFKAAEAARKEKNARH